MHPRPVVLFAALLLTAAAAPSALAVESASDPLAGARAIIALEHQRATLLESWDREQADLERLAAARAISIDTKKARIAALKAQLDKRSKDAAERTAEAQRLADDQAAVRAAIQAAATVLSSFAPPQLFEHAVIDQLREAAAAFDKLRAAAARYEVEVAEGVLPDGKTIAIQVLKAGLAAAWYASLDGASGGYATRDGAHWKLTPDADAQVAAVAISAAIAQLRGNTVPEAVLLPPPPGATP